MDHIAYRDYIGAHLCTVVWPVSTSVPFNQFKPISLLLSFFVSNDPLKMTKDINDVG